MVFSKTGTAEVATDPMPPNASDGFVILKPQKDWPAGVRTKAQVLARIEARLKPLLGNAYEVSQPIQLRFNELIAGVRGDVAVRLYGDDLGQMSATAANIAAVLQTIPGAADVRAEQTAGRADPRRPVRPRGDRPLRPDHRGGGRHRRRGARRPRGRPGVRGRPPLRRGGPHFR